MSNETSSGWPPLFEGERAARMRGVIDEICDALDDVPPGEPGLDGAAGRALLLMYAGREDRAAAALDEACAGLADARGPGLWGGAAGLRWAVAHLAGGDEAAELCGMIDDALLQILDAPGGDYDLISGLAGIGVAALEDVELGRGREVVARVLDGLERAATRDDDGLFWHTPARLLPDWQRELCPGGYINLGLAHGMPGVVGVCAQAIAAGVDVERARRLIDSAVAWLLATTPPRAAGRFAAWRAPEAADEPARLAWCYGDPGVAITLLAAARATGDARWEREAIELARAMAARPVDTSGVADTGLCHGAAGVAHIFHRLFRATGDAVLGDAARAWFERTLAMRNDHPVAGFPAWQAPDGVRQWVADGSLLSGAAGVALALLGAIDAHEPAWDRALLTSVPGGRA